jgi:hypothetical protein
MRETSFAEAGSANFGGAQSGNRIRTIGRAISVIRGKAREIWRNKTAVELAARTGLSLHTTEKILSGDRGMGLDAFAALMETAEGIEFFGAIVDAMPDRARRRWHDEFERAARQADLRRRKELLEADEERAAAEADQMRLSLSRLR